MRQEGGKGEKDAKANGDRFSQSNLSGYCSLLALPLLLEVHGSCVSLWFKSCITGPGIIPYWTRLGSASQLIWDAHGQCCYSISAS